MSDGAAFLPSVCPSGKKKDGDLAAAMSRAGALESQLNQSEAALSTALSQNAALTSDLLEVKGLLAKVRCELWADSLAYMIRWCRQKMGGMGGAIENGLKSVENSKCVNVNNSSSCLLHRDVIRM